MFIALVSGGGGGGFFANYEVREGEWRITVTEDCNGLDFTLSAKGNSEQVRTLWGFYSVSISGQF